MADQLNHDSRWTKKGYTGSDLLNDIIKALERKEIEWPDYAFCRENHDHGNPRLAQNEWIARMKIDSKFYRDHGEGIQEMRFYEEVLLILVANTLERVIKLIPIFDDEVQRMIVPRPVPIQTGFYSKRIL